MEILMFEDSGKMLSEVALSSSSTDTLINLIDFRTGTSYTSFKQNNCFKHALALIPYPGQCDRIGLIISAQLDKSLLHIYSFQKDQVHLKFISPEKIIALAVSNKGAFCAGGTDNGKIYIWEISTGTLCKVFDAHYKKISVIKFTSDDSALISGSEDAGVNVWLLSSLLDDSVDESPSPFYTWSEHSLPITDIWCGIGSFNTARIVTSSLDHTCKLWDLSTGYLLTTFIFPTAITCIIVDPAERMFFGGGSNNLIYQVYLYRRRESSNYNAFGEEMSSVGGAGSIEDISSIDDEKGNLFKGHNSAITALALSYDASLLLAGSKDGTLMIWDISSKQMIKKFSLHKGPITNLFTFLKPPDLISSTSNLSNKIMIQPIQLFQRNTLQRSYKDNFDELHDLQRSKQSLLQFQVDDNSSTLESQISSLQSELLRVHNQYQRVKGLHDEMYQEIVNNFMANRREIENQKKGE
ncbi:15547_t:CDS:2 [Funneliformis caledonium]|uniref:15547_t:CDS:1 n=1 Tax=Funneliformis caledonium TaxID=1117310 RepID=A0A9N9GYY5_9GLOM|nr:15547_t:CDS:2 [Funneliformis caledonium]